MSGTLIALFGLGVVIFIHELGHMLFAKRAGIGVYEFAIGMGPKLLSKTYNGTEYSLRLLPLGGFVRLAGLDNDEDTAPDNINFYKKSRWNRFLTLVAGAGMNVLFGFILFILLFTLIGTPRLTSSIESVLPNSPAHQAGLVGGDTVIRINSTSVADPLTDIIQTIQQSNGAPLTLTIDRSGQSIETIVRPELSKGSDAKWLIGIKLAASPHRHGPVQAIIESMRSTLFHIQMVFKSLHLLITRNANFNEMAGPIGIVQLAGSQATTNWYGFFNLLAMISISLGIINLFPFPVLDGGHILLLAIESIRKKRLSSTWETRINQAGVSILITLMIIVIYNDVINWSTRAELFRSFSK